MISTKLFKIGITSLHRLFCGNVYERKRAMVNQATLAGSAKRKCEAKKNSNTNSER